MRLALRSDGGSGFFGRGSFHDLVFGGVDGGFDLGFVGLLGVEGDGSLSAHVTDFIDIHDAFGLSENGGEVVAARLAGEAGDLEGSFLAGDFEAAVGDDFFNLGDLHFFRVILDHDGVGFVAAGAAGDSGEGSEGGFGCFGGGVVIEAGHGEFDHGAVTAVFGAAVWAFGSGACFGSRSFLGLGE